MEARHNAFGEHPMTILDKVIYYFRVKQLAQCGTFDDCVVLDLGCGYNALSLQHIAGKYCPKELIAFDLSLNEKLLRQKNIECVLGDLNKPFDLEKQVDVVLGTAILEHLADPLSFLTTIYTHLRPGGRLILTVPSIWSQPLLEFMAYKLHIIDELEIRDHKKYYTKTSLIDLLVLAGFDLSAIQHRYFGCYLNNFVLVTK